METWTEYGWQDESGQVTPCDENTIEYARAYVNYGERIVGATVTRSDWLPVDQGGAS